MQILRNAQNGAQAKPFPAAEITKPFDTIRQHETIFDSVRRGNALLQSFITIVRTEHRTDHSRIG